MVECAPEHTDSSPDADEADGDDRPSIYLGSAWFPGVVTLGLLSHIVLTQSTTVFDGWTGAFFAGVIGMHIAVALTEVFAQKRYGGSES